MRGSMSAVPPAGKGTMIRNGRFGSCARAGAATNSGAAGAAAAMAASVRSARRRAPVSEVMAVSVSIALRAVDDTRHRCSGDHGRDPGGNLRDRFAAKRVWAEMCGVIVIAGQRQNG